MELLIVESPTKSRTIQRFLDPKKFEVFSSYGHIRDLPAKDFGVDIDNNFTPKYVISLKARKNLKPIKEALKKSKSVILATDEDREGEAIAWHLIKALGLDEVKSLPRTVPPKAGLVRGEKSRRRNRQAKMKDYSRIVFHEITKRAIDNALKNPREIDTNLVDAQQARRILDRIVGYKISPFLWKKVFRGLSAGRVQSVAVRLIVEREREIEKFAAQEYWEIEAELKKRRTDAEQEHGTDAEKQPPKTDAKNAFAAKLYKKEDKIIPRLGIKNQKEAETIINDLKDAEYQVAKVEKKEIQRNPLPPFTTSSLQQEAWKRFRWPAKMTMQIAQNLYERGCITYHRTDSFNLSSLALLSAKKFIITEFGNDYWPGFPRQYKTKSKTAQEAHEAIRPTYPKKTPENLSAEAKLDQRQLKLYDLIWRRFLACQMTEATFDSTNVEVEANPKSEIQSTKQIQNSKSQIPNYTFQTRGQTLIFDGFLKIYPLKFEENELPELETKEILELLKLLPSQHFTQPPARYTEATLIKELEKNGIGRPSTYAPILSTIQERNYAEKDEKKSLKPTETGVIVNDLLVEHFPKVVDVQFTAKMEDELDEIAGGKKNWTKVLDEFYRPFAENLEQKYSAVKKSEVVPEEKTNKICPECKSPIVVRFGRYGKFYACSNFPKCKYTEPLKPTTLGIECPKCRKGEIAGKRTKRGKIFYGCNRFPECDFALWDKPVNQTCPKCGSLLIQTTRKKIKCSNKECDFVKEETIDDIKKSIDLRNR